MASKGGVGLEIDVERVPLREPDLEPFEVMVSESQERMLAVIDPSRLDDVRRPASAGRPGSRRSER
jgi:phosphoribosylformylglycinamidine synthase